MLGLGKPAADIPNFPINTGNEVISGGTPYEVGTSADGGVMMSDGSVQGGSGTGIGSPGGVGGYAGAGVALYNGYQGATDERNLSPGERNARAVQGVGRAAGAYATGGLSELGLAGIDAIAGKGTTQKGFDKYDSAMDSDIMKVINPIGAFGYKALKWGTGKLLGGQTKYTEARNLDRLKKDGLVDDAFIRNFMPNAEKIGKGGRKGIDAEADYKATLSRTGSEEEAQRQKKYAELVKSGKDQEAIGMLRGKDIWGYGNVAEKIAKATGKNYSTGLSESQREQAAQAILDNGALYSSKGSYNVKDDAELDAILKGIGDGQTASKPILQSDKPKAPEAKKPSSSSSGSGITSGISPQQLDSNFVNYPGTIDTGMQLSSDDAAAIKKALEEYSKKK